MHDLPRMLADYHRPPGIIKADYSDFIVEEIPLYPADGQGTHTYFLLEKQGLSTMQAAAELSRALNLPRHALGIAGLKDARAVTRQWISVEHVDPAALVDLELPRMRILQTTRHGNKLRIGHLKGNRFVIKVRGEFEHRLAELQTALHTLATQGVPNYFGEQRFGYRGDSWQIGGCILRGDLEGAVDLMLGRPTEHDKGAVREARALYDKGDYDKARRMWPRLFHTERKALSAIVRGQGKKKRGFAAIDRSIRNFMISAYQSYLFNQVVMRRLPGGLGRLMVGDLAWLHASGAVFRVEDLDREQPRADTLEISPSGPLFGYRSTEPAGEPQAMENAILDAEGLKRSAFNAGPLRVKGGRRPLRFTISAPQMQLGADTRGSYVELQFMLPRGSYATAVLRELFALGREAREDAEVDEAEAD